MNQKKYSYRATLLEYRIGQALNSKEFDWFSAKEIQTIPDVVELARIMIGTLVEENARNMSQRELQAFYNIKNEFLSLTDMLN